MDHKTTIIGVAGASGAGKSYLSKLLLNRLCDSFGENEAVILNEDCYYHRRDELSLEQRAEINYDHPDAFEHELLCKHLQQLKSGNEALVPQYDYSLHNRKSETTVVPACRLVILEGILILHNAQLREQLDLKVFVDVNLDICLTRRIRRDTSERGRTLECVLSQYETTVKPMYHQFIEPTKAHADLIVPFSGPNDQAVDVLFNHLSRLWD